MTNIEEAEKMINEIIQEDDCFSIKKLRIKGSDLINIGINEGKGIGEILNQLLELVINGEISNEHDELLETAKRIKEKR
jgi:tRNA nucleotidyltransferase (CCA-adding enzyme)